MHPSVIRLHLSPERNNFSKITIQALKKKKKQLKKKYGGKKKRDNVIHWTNRTQKAN